MFYAIIKMPYGPVFLENEDNELPMRFDTDTDAENAVRENSAAKAYGYMILDYSGEEISVVG